MRDERRGGRFPVGPGDGDKRRTRRDAAALAAEQLDVADHLDGGFSRERNAPVRAGMGERNAGREHQRRDLRPIELPQVGGRNAGGVRLRHALRIIVEGDHVGAAGEERARAHQSRAAQPEHRDLLTGEGGERESWCAFRAFLSRTRAALVARPSASLWGGLRGGGREVMRERRRTARHLPTPLPALAYKAGGSSGPPPPTLACYQE